MLALENAVIISFHKGVQKDYVRDIHFKECLAQDFHNLPLPGRVPNKNGKEEGHK